MPNPQNAGAFGAAILVAAGMGRISSAADAKSLLPEYTVFTPTQNNRTVYDMNYAVFKSLYKNNKKSFSALNSTR
jgi:xylulokinase